MKEIVNNNARTKNYEGPMQFGGFFKKLKINSIISKVFNPYNNRYFIIDLINRKFTYKTCADSQDEIRSHNLSELISWTAHKCIDKEHPVNCPLCIVITFSDKLYTLFTGNSLTFSKFTQALSFIQKSKNNFTINKISNQANNKETCLKIENQVQNQNEEDIKETNNNHIKSGEDKDNFTKTPVNLKFFSRKKFEESFMPRKPGKNKVKKNNFFDKIPIKRASFPSVIIETTSNNQTKNEGCFTRLYISNE